MSFFVKIKSKTKPTYLNIFSNNIIFLIYNVFLSHFFLYLTQQDNKGYNYFIRI